MIGKLLLSSDMDRTLLPNGPQPESPRARPLFRELAARPEVIVAYATGRDRRLILEAVHDHALPLPDFAIGDVGTTIHRIEDGEWFALERWDDEIGEDWNGRRWDDVVALAEPLSGLRLQEPERQNRFKVSFYTRPDFATGEGERRLARTLCEAGLRAAVVCSVDETRDLGLCDVIPASATKLHATRFLRRHLGIPEQRTVFAGDSGNDLAALTSELPAVLVANATPAVREAASRMAREAGHSDRLYLARGGFLGMNGCYSAGVLEGLAHYLPETSDWLA